ncbi:MAG: EthD family reductase [Rhodobacteraceae bacterium]|nr:EthD family reductase [Paracoccaceae bacterium]
MASSLQVIYPVADGTTFDYEYYLSKHMEIVGACMGPHIESTLVTKGLAGGPDAPPGYYAVATILCKDQDAMTAMLAAAGPALADIPNFTNVQPHMLIGEVVA